MVLADQCAPDAPMGIVVFSLQTGQRRCLDSPQRGEEGDFGPVVSPDQKSVAFIRARTLSNRALYTVDLAGGHLRRLTSDAGIALGPMWSADGQRIVFESDRVGLFRFWQVPAAGGAIEGVFSASGVVPQVAEAWRARGTTVESAIFSRPPSR